MRVPADQFRGDGFDHVAEIEGALLLGHTGVVSDLEQEIAQLVLEVVQIAARDGVGHLIGFLQRIGRDGLEGLLQVPGAAAAGRAQRRHDLEQPGNVAGGLQGLVSQILKRRDLNRGRRVPRPSGPSGI